MNELNDQEMQQVAGGDFISDWPRQFEDGTHVIVYDISGKEPEELYRGTIQNHKKFDLSHDFDWLCDVLTDSGELIEAYENTMAIG